MVRLATNIFGRCLAVGLSGYCATAEAQTRQPPKQATSPGLPNGASATSDDIIVTAQKRSEPVQKVPIAITAVTGAALAKSGITNLEGLQNSVPTLSLGQTTGAARIALRGVGSENLGTGAEGSIAFHVNGIFIARTAAALASFYDVDRIEVLRGPQGTLYGRNATAGAINVITREPTKNFGGYVNLTYGNYNTLKAEGAVSGPIVSDKILARVAYLLDYRDGYGKNIISGRDIDNSKSQSIRATLEFRPAEAIKWLVSGDYHHENDRNYSYHYFGHAGFTATGVPIIPTGLLAGGITAPKVQDIASEIDPRNIRKFWGISSDLSWDLGFGHFRSLTAYRSTEYQTVVDLDQTSALIASPLSQAERARQFSQELQLTGGSNRLQWLLGAYYFHETDKSHVTVPISLSGVLFQAIDNRGTLGTNATAGFGQLTYEVLPALHVTAGARYSSEKKSINNASQTDFTRHYSPSNPFLPTVFQVESKRFSAFTPRISIDYSLTPSKLLYASYSRGFKSGNYKVGTPQPVLRPEKITAYEAGLKSTFGGGLLRLNVAGFYYDYTDLQVGKLVGVSIALENAASARVYGVELESRLRPTSNLELNLTGAWLHARFKDYVSFDPSRPAGDGITKDGTRNGFNLAGKTLSQAPNFFVSGGAEYRIDLPDHRLTLRGEAAWTDRIYFSPFNVTQVSQGPRTKVNAFVTYAPNSEDWSLTFYAKNIGGKRYVQNSYINTSSVGFTVTGGLEEPRLYGLTARYNF